MKKKYFLILIISICFINPLSARFNWPTRDVIFTSHFGESRGDHWHNGVDIVSANYYTLYAPQDGEIIFRRDVSDSPMPDKFGAGNFLVIDHNNDLRTFYYHLEDNTVIKDKYRVTTSDVIAQIGNTGRSSGAHLHLSLYSTKNDRILNPVDYFTEFSNLKKPIIQKILLKGPMSDYSNIMRHQRIRKKSFFRVIVTAHDVREGPVYMNAPLGARSIELIIDDKSIKKISFDYLELKNNTYCLNGDLDITFERLYLNEPYYIDIAGFVPTNDKHSFTVKVTDNAGLTNETTVNVNFY